MGFINFLIVKSLVKTKFANIINITANEEIIPELLQSKCNSENIYENVSNFLENPNQIKNQLKKVNSVLKELKPDELPSEIASLTLNKLL